MDDKTRTDIVIAAINAAGPVPPLLDGAGNPVLDGQKRPVLDHAEWQTRVAMGAAQITAMTGDRHKIVGVIEGTAAAKVFPATITKVAREDSSTRALVSLKTRPSDQHPDGIEQARTERTDDPLGLAMARLSRGLLGHRVLVWIEVQTMGDGGRKVRVIRHIEDQGVDVEVARELGILADAA